MALGRESSSLSARTKNILQISDFVKVYYRPNIYYELLQALVFVLERLRSLQASGLALWHTFLVLGANQAELVTSRGTNLSVG